jgi:4-hydroxy-tetrahydrodipicolinate reductase
MSESTSLRLLIHGASGRMGRALLRLAAADSRFAIATGVSRNGGEADGVPLLPVARIDAAPDFDVALDFSLSEGFDVVLALCRRRGCALVSGTTGLNDAQRALVESAANEIPILWSANFSMGVTVLTELVRRVAAALPGWDCDIVETHHRHKRDAPSGTALTLGAAVHEARGAHPHYASLRAGDVVGEHAVQFATDGERLELIHRATDRDIFARGALEAAARIAGRPAGNYRLADLFMAR